MRRAHIILGLLIGILTLLIGSLIQFRSPVVTSQWRGENRDGIYHERNLLKQWLPDGPELLWYNDSLPEGYSQPCVGEEMIYLTGLVDSTDYLIALNHKGIEQWRKPIAKGWVKSFSSSRSTPTLVNNKLFVQTGYGFVACFDASSGNEIWKVNAFEKFEGKTGGWGYSESLLVVNNKVLVTIGGHKTSMVALDVNSGETLWQSKTLNDTTAYASPILIHENGKDIAVNVMGNNIFGVDVANGEILFSKNYSLFENHRATAVWNMPSVSRVNANNPLYFNRELYITSGYNHVGVKYKLSDDLSELNVVWTDTILDVHFGGVVLVDGYIYGSNWINNANGNWCSLNWDTGKIGYETKWNNKGSIIYADGMLYVYDEKRGNIALVKPNPEKFEVLSSFKIPYGKGRHWSQPIIKNGLLYIRHGSAIMAYNVQEK